MQRLLEQCLFHREYSNSPKCLGDVSKSISVDVLSDFVRRGRAKLIATAAYTSVSVKEASQGDVAHLPCGSRSLLVDKESGDVIVRGVNKFFSIDEVDGGWMTDDSLWRSCTVWAQRKMAGFVVTLFSTDGVHLSCMSKHVVEGHHVDMAQEVMNAQLSSEQRELIARDLFQMECSASCECICLDNDIHHPVLECNVFDGTLTLLSIQKSHALAEVAMPFREVQTIAGQWGMTCVPGHVLSGQAALQQVISCAQSWHAQYPHYATSTDLAEGFVVLVECSGPGEYLQGSQWVTPIRVKVKTVEYTVLRSLRSLIRGDSQPRELLYHRAVATWAQASFVDLVAQEKQVGVYALYKKFEGQLAAQARHRHRGAHTTVGHAYQRLTTITEDEGGMHKPCHLTLVMMCGLPGVGKSTICSELLSLLCASPNSSFDFGVHLCRDAASADVSLRHGINESSSKHQQRRLGSLVHREMLSLINCITRYTAVTGKRGIVLFDACNATEGTRAQWRRSFPSEIDAFHLVHVECSDAQMQLARLGARQGHQTVKNADEAQQALYTVRRKFVPPAAERGAIRIDTAAHSAVAAATSLVGLFVCSLDGKKGAMQAMKVDELDAEVRQLEGDLLHCLLGPNQPVSLVAHGAAAAQKRSPRRVFAVQLDTTMETLRELVAKTLMDVFSRAEPQPSSGWRTWLHAITRSVRGTASSSADTVVSGQVKWIKGWLLRSSQHECAETAVLTAALLKRFEVEPQCPHVTLLHCPDGVTGVAEFWSQSQLRVGQEVRVELTEVLLDRFAAAFSARVSQWSHQWPAGEAALPLHVTVGTAPRVTAAYAGGMLPRFALWQQQNESLAADKTANRAARSQQKFVNFAQLGLSQPVILTGKVVELPQQ